MRRAFIAIPAVLAITSPPALAQKPVTAYHVYQACRHPAAFPQDSFDARPGQVPVWSGLAVHSGRDSKLSYLCSRVNLWNPGMSWRVASQTWADAATAGQLPNTAELIAYAHDSERALYSWLASSPEAVAGEGAHRLALPMLPFRENSAEVAQEDSATVRRIAEMLRDHLSRYPDDVVTILGQADPTGSASRNLVLATQRARNLLQALVRYDDGTFARNVGRLRTAAHVVSRPAIEERVEAAASAAATGAVARAEAAVGARAGELLKARAPTFVARSGSGALTPRLTRDDPLLTSTPSSTAPGGARTGSIAIAIVDVVGETASEQVQIFLVEEVTRNICGRGKEEPTARVVQFRRLLPSTCALFGSAATNQLFRPTVGTLRSAVRQDIDGIMPKLLGTALQTQFRAPNEERRAEAVFALALAQYLTAVATGEDALQAASRVHERLPALIPPAAWNQAKNVDVAVYLRQAAPFLSLYREARTKIRGGVDPEAVRNEVFTLSIRAMLVNVGGAQVRQDVWGDDPKADLTRVLETMPTVLEATQQLESTYAAYRQASGASTEQRLGLAAELVSGSADLFMALLPETMSSGRTEHFRRLTEPARDMTTALTRRDYRAALVNGLVLAQNVAPPAEKSAGAECRLPNGLYCPGLVLPGDQMRLATFAADFANATDQGGTNEALRNFVSQGGGYRSKREGSPRSFVSVNAYLGLSGAHEVGYSDGARTNNQAAFYLPVGIELGRRTGWPALPSASLFLQIVDLGGVAASRYRDNDEVDTPDPELFDVLSPGAYAVFSIPRAPLSVGVGASAVPRAQVVVDGLRERISGAVRMSVFLAVDVPLFP